jgi:hypothetical protein
LRGSLGAERAAKVIFGAVANDIIDAIRINEVAS